ncbi:MAG: transposase [Dehalococcoidia bacterium]
MATCQWLKYPTNNGPSSWDSCASVPTSTLEEKRIGGSYWKPSCVARRGAAWRLLPEHFGHWNIIYERLARRCEKRVWQQVG